MAVKRYVETGQAPATYPTATDYVAVDFDISLVKLDKAKIADVVKLAGENRQFLSKTLARAHLYDSDLMTAELQQQQVETDHGLRAPYAILHQGLLAGVVALHSRQGSSSQMGYWLSEKYTSGQDNRRSIMTRASQGLRDYGFMQWGIETIDLHIKPNNEASARVANKLGATIIGQTVNDLSGQLTKYDVWRVRKDES